MIEIEIPKDIRKYESKLVGPLTTRQTICFVIGAVIGITIYSVLSFLPQDFKMILVLIAVSPLILCGWYKPYGMHFEKFVQTALISNVLAPVNRKYVTKNLFEDDAKPVDTKNKKNKNNKTKPSKDFVAYQ